MTRAEQFAFFEINEPSFAEFCPMVQRYGEFMNRSRAGESNSAEASHAQNIGADNPYAVPCIPVKKGAPPEAGPVVSSYKL